MTMILRLVLTFFMFWTAYVCSLTHNEVDMKLRNAMRLELDETIDTGKVEILRVIKMCARHRYSCEHLISSLSLE